MKKIFVPLLLLTGFFTPFQNVYAQVNYSLVCVDSVWYSSNPQFINVRIYNGDTLQMNYPSVQIVSPVNDTIGNPSNFVNYFAQLGNTYQTYTDTITQPGIPDFSSYTFLIHEGFGSTTAVINWCGPLSTQELQEPDVKIFPNPVSEILYVSCCTSYNIHALEIYNNQGNLVLQQKPGIKFVIEADLSALPGGVYFIRVTDNRKNFHAKLVKQ